MGRRFALVVLAAGAVALPACSGSTDGCDDGGSCVSLVGGTAATAPSAVDRLGEAELAAMMAVAVPAAIVADPDNGGAVKPQRYRIGDAFGSAGDDQVVYSEDGSSSPISGAVQAAISAALAPGSAQFVAADPSRGMLRIGLPEHQDGSWRVEFEFFCGGDPAALCGSGVALRMQQVAGTWTVVEVLSSWIS